LGSTVTVYEWDLDGNGTFETNTGNTPSATASYPNAGTIVVSLRVTDSDGDTDEDSVSLRVHSLPSAGFIFEPSNPSVGEQVTFSSTSSDADGPIASHQWDFDADGLFDDAIGSTVTHTFTSAGLKVVSLQATDADGAVASVSREVPVAVAAHNQRPDASFVFSPKKPRAGAKVELTSTSTDAEGPLQALRWDLDGDGGFDDASGRIVEKKFKTKGSVSIGLQVIDQDGAEAVAINTVQVGPRRLDLLSPFPVIRLSGTVKPSGLTNIDRLTVRGPKGAHVTVRCHGSSCPFRARHRAVKHSRLRFSGLEKPLRPGVVIEVLVTEADRIGKFTKFRLRAKKTPKRVDRCLKGKRRNPIPCPRS
jgi:PKD repeat protein